MADISEKYQSQIKDYRESHFGDDPGMIRNIIFGLRSVFSSVKITDSSQGSTTNRKSLSKTRHRIITLDSRKIDHPATLLTRIRSLLSDPKPAPHLIPAEEFKAAARNNDYSKYSGSVFIDGNLDLSDIPDITELPERLYVDGNLILSGCKKLRSLPKDKLRVSGSLKAENCSNIKKVTKDIKVGGNISFRSCMQLSEIPLRLMDIGYRSDSKRRHIYLEKTNIPSCYLYDTKKCLFHFSSPWDENNPSDRAIRTIMDWSDDAGMGSDLPVIDLTDRESIHLDSWLKMIGRSVYFPIGYDAFKKQFYRRVMKVIIAVLNDPKYKEAVIDNIEIANSRGFDALSLDDAEKLFLIKRAEAMIDVPDAEQKLRDLARQIMHLQMLEDYVLSNLKKITGLDLPGDRIEVMLDFKAKLRKTLNLPINLEDMNYWSRGNVPKKHIKEAKEYVLNQSTPDALDAFLSNWAPWKKLKDKQSVPDYLALDTCTPPAEQECLICREVTDQMVVLNNRPYDYENLKKWYLEAGTDPFTREKIIWSEVKRFSRSESDDSSHTSPS